MKHEGESEQVTACAQCRAPLPPESRFCTECGASVGKSCLVEPEGLMLAQANLLRMRGRWEEAAEQCAEVLRRHPTSASAHSLLGDIYENQGRLAEAIHWYQLALELNPDSVADQAKLARAAELQRARMARCARRSAASGTTISWLRVATVAGVAFCCTVLALAIVVSASERHLRTQETPVVSRPEPVSGSLVARSWRRIAPSHTSRERDLLVALHGIPQRPPAPGDRSLLRPVALALDPRGPSATLTLLLDPMLVSGAGRSVNALLPPDVGARMQREIYRLSAHLVRLDPTIALVHARVLVPMTDPTDRREPELAFLATLDAAALRTDPALLSDTDLSGLFRDTWWGPPFAR